MHDIRWIFHQKSIMVITVNTTSTLETLFTLYLAQQWEWRRQISRLSSSGNKCLAREYFDHLVDILWLSSEDSDVRARRIFQVTRRSRAKMVALITLVYKEEEKGDSEGYYSQQLNSSKILPWKIRVWDENISSTNYITVTSCHQLTLLTETPDQYCHWNLTIMVLCEQHLYHISEGRYQKFYL